MNTYTKDLTGGTLAMKNRSDAKDKSCLAWFAVRISLICVMIFGAIACRVYFTGSVERMNKQITQIQTKTREVNIQICNLRNTKENLTSWPNISKNISRYNLKLSEADYHQVSYVALIPENGKSLQKSIPVPGIRTAKLSAKDYLMRAKRYSQH